MSIITSTPPEWLKALIAPPADNATVTWFGTGGPMAAQLRFETFGNAASAGKTARNDVAVGLAAVTLEAIPVAEAGMLQPPFEPVT